MFNSMYWVHLRIHSFDMSTSFPLEIPYIYLGINASQCPMFTKNIYIDPQYLNSKFPSNGLKNISLSIRNAYRAIYMVYFI